MRNEPTAFKVIAVVRQVSIVAQPKSQKIQSLHVEQNPVYMAHIMWFYRENNHFLLPHALKKNCFWGRLATDTIRSSCTSEDSDLLTKVMMQLLPSIGIKTETPIGKR